MLWTIIFKVTVILTLSDLDCYFEVILIQYKNMHITCTGAFMLNLIIGNFIMRKLRLKKSYLYITILCVSRNIWALDECEKRYCIYSFKNSLIIRHLGEHFKVGWPFLSSSQLKQLFRLTTNRQSVVYCSWISYTVVYWYILWYSCTIWSHEMNNN